jgi:hypothetical protein
LKKRFNSEFAKDAEFTEKEAEIPALMVVTENIPG